MDAVGLTMGRRADVLATLQVLEVLLRFCHVRYQSFNPFADGLTEAPEAMLSRELCQALQHEKDLNAAFQPVKEVNIGEGFVDLYFASRNAALPGVVLELKAKDQRFATIEKKFAGQALHYVEDGGSHVAIMLSCFRQSAPLVLSDTLSVIPSAAGGSKLGLISLGLKAAGDAPSSGKMAAKPTR